MRIYLSLLIGRSAGDTSSQAQSLEFTELSVGDRIKSLVTTPLVTKIADKGFEFAALFR
jgi:hypothetical protein